MTNNKCAMEGSAKRDDTLGKTVYEVAIKAADISAAFANYDVNFEKDTEFALSFSINTDDGSQKVLRLRDGGSIFGRNDYSKAPNAVLLGAKQTAPDTSEPATEPSEPEDVLETEPPTEAPTVAPTEPVADDSGSDATLWIIVGVITLLLAGAVTGIVLFFKKRKTAIE